MFTHRPPLPMPRPTRWQPLCIGLVVTGLFWPLSAVAQDILPATIREILDGKDVFIQNNPAKVNDVVRTRGEVISTKRASRAGLLFSPLQGGIRLGKNSSLTLGRQCVQLKQGEVIIAGTIGRNGCVGSIQVASLGTVYIMKIDNQNRAQVVVLEGSVQVFNLQTPDLKVAVGAGQGVSATSEGALATTSTGSVDVTSFTTAQLQDIAAPLVEGFQVPLPDLDKVAFLRPQGFAATFLRDALVGREGEFEYWDGQKQGDLSRQPSSFQVFGESGTFIRDTSNTGRFILDSPMTTIPLSVDFDAQTLSIVGVPGITSSAGLSGNNASGTVVLPNGQVIRLEVFGVNKKEPPIGTPFRGTLGSGTARDR